MEVKSYIYNYLGFWGLLIVNKKLYKMLQYCKKLYIFV